MACRQRGQLTKWQVAKMVSEQNSELTKWQAGKMKAEFRGFVNRPVLFSELIKNFSFSSISI
jgi:hypothetical protein